MVCLHVVGLPHTGLEDRFSWCAYTGKVRRFAPMMTAQGYDVVTYHAGQAEERDAWRAGEYVCVLPEWERHARFGTGLPVPTFDGPMFSTFNTRAVAEIQDRIEPGDLICLIAGAAQAPIAAVFPASRTVEFGVGYSGVITSGTFRAFESYAWMHAVYGSLAGSALGSYAGHNYDAVIPNYYDPAEFPLREADDGYLLFLGRVGDYLKGIREAVAVARAANIPLVTAGPGVPPPGTDHRGIVGPAERAALLGHCTALIQPTEFLEPFGGSVVEALLCGVPVITSDWGAFPENVGPGDGKRCRTLQEYVDAVAWARLEKDTAPEEGWFSETRDMVRQIEARRRWSMGAVGPQFAAWFERIATLDGDGWYTLNTQPVPDA